MVQQQMQAQQMQAQQQASQQQKKRPAEKNLPKKVGLNEKESDLWWLLFVLNLRVHR